MIKLSEAEIDDLRYLSDLCERMQADLVIVGAIAYQIHLPDKERLTQDIDFAIALDLDDFEDLCNELKSSKWEQVPKREQGWRSPNGALLDLLPAGKTLREQKHVTWPSGFTMIIACTQSISAFCRTLLIRFGRHFGPPLRVLRPVESATAINFRHGH